MEIGIALLEMDKTDLESSKVLFGNKLYPQAVFHLQQSVEKAVKSLAIHDNIITEDKLKKIGHDPIKIYVAMFDHWKSFGLAIRDSRLGEIFPEFRTMVPLKKIYMPR